MKHEEVEVGKQYTVNTDRPFESNLEEGEQVTVVAEFPTPFPGNPCHFRVQSMKTPNEGEFVPTWIVTCENLDPANPDWIDPNAPEPEPTDDVASAS